MEVLSHGDSQTGEGLRSEDHIARSASSQENFTSVPSRGMPFLCSYGKRRKPTEPYSAGHCSNLLPRRAGNDDWRGHETILGSGEDANGIRQRVVSAERYGYCCRAVVEKRGAASPLRGSGVRLGQAELSISPPPGHCG